MENTSCDSVSDIRLGLGRTGCNLVQEVLVTNLLRHEGPR